MNTTATKSDKFHTFRVLNWPHLDGYFVEKQVALRARDRIRAEAEREAYGAGADVVRIVTVLGTHVDTFPIDVRKFVTPEGCRVVFPSKSDPSGERFGRVKEVSETRVLVSYKFKNGRATEKWVSKRHVYRAAC